MQAPNLEHLIWGSQFNAWVCPAVPLGQNYYITYVFLNSFPQLCNNFLHYRIGLELFSQLCIVVCWCQAYHADIGLHVIIVFQLICRLCNISLYYRIGFEFNYVIISVAVVTLISACSADSGPVTPILLVRSSKHFAESWPQIMSQGLCRQPSSNPDKA